MANSNVKIGDVVRLKSGGPLMTVESLDDYYGVMKARCTWFSNHELKDGVFPPETLVLDD